MRKIISVVLCGILMLPMCFTASASEETVAGNLSAKSAILMEISTGKVLMESNPDEKLSPASITKVMTILLTLEALENEQIKLEDRVTASKNASSKGGSQIWLAENEKLNSSGIDTLLTTWMFSDGFNVESKINVIKFDNVEAYNI